VLPFADDNTIACLSLGGEWTAVVRRVATSIWKRYHYQLSDDKTEVNTYDTETWAPVLGRILDARGREIRLTAPKVDRYCNDIDAAIALAKSRDDCLVPKKTCEQLFGRLLFACECGVGSIWRDFLSMVSCVSSRWSTHWVQLDVEAQAILSLAKFKLRNMNGTAFTPYVLRPLQDTFPVVVSYTDASRKPVTMTGGYGGWIWLYGTKTVYYFHGVFSSFEIQNTDINELETKAAAIAAELAMQVVPQVDADDGGGPVMSYLYQFGDSDVFFTHVMPGATASAHGLRFLYQQRATADQHLPRLTGTQHVKRGLNQAADYLSNGLVQKFQLEIQKMLGPSLEFIRLLVTPEQASMQDLIAWKNLCAQGKEN
jgi:hypothetical protein